MGLILRLVLIAAGAVVAVFVARDAPNFGVVQGMFALAAIAGALLLLAALSRRR